MLPCLPYFRSYGFQGLVKIIKNMLLPFRIALTLGNIILRWLKLHVIQRWLSISGTLFRVTFQVSKSKSKLLNITKMTPRIHSFNAQKNVVSLWRINTESDSPYVDCNTEWYPFCGFDTKWDSPYVDSTQNEILLMLIQHRMRFSLCWFNPGWDSHIVLIHHTVRFSFCWFMLIFQHRIRFFLFWFSNMEWDSLMLIQHTIRFTEWYFPSVESIVSLSQSRRDSPSVESTENEIPLQLSQHRVRFSLCWINTEWDSPSVESVQNEIPLTPSQRDKGSNF